MQPGQLQDVEDLPMLVYQQHGDSHLQACAEIYLSDRVVDALSDCGLMALVSHRSRNIVRPSTSAIDR